MKSSITFIIACACMCSLAVAQDMNIGGQVGVAIPSGRFGDGWKTGFGFTAYGMYQLEQNVHGTASLGYTTFPRSSALANVEGHYYTIPLLAGVRYLFTGFSPQWYVGGELGLNFTTDKREKKTPLGTEVTSNSETAFGLGLMGGINYRLNEQMTLDANIKYVIMFTEFVDRPYLAFNAGIFIPLNL